MLNDQSLENLLQTFLFPFFVVSGKRAYPYFGWKSKRSVFCGQISLPFCFLKKIYFYSFSWLCLVLFAALRIFVAAYGIDFSYDM